MMVKSELLEAMSKLLKDECMAAPRPFGRTAFVDCHFPTPGEAVARRSRAGRQL
jgi:hypothetical protein